MDHEFSCSKEEAHQYWTVPDWHKVSNNPEMNAHAHEHHILDDGVVADDDADGYFSDGQLPSDKKEEVTDNCFFDHLKYGYANEYHGQREDFCVKLDQDVFVESGAASPEQDVTMQSAEDDSSNIPMTMRRPPLKV